MGATDFNEMLSAAVNVFPGHIQLFKADTAGRLKIAKEGIRLTFPEIRRVAIAAARSVMPGSPQELAELVSKNPELARSKVIGSTTRDGSMRVAISDHILERLLDGMKRTILSSYEKQFADAVSDDLNRHYGNVIARLAKVMQAVPGRYYGPFWDAIDGLENSMDEGALSQLVDESKRYMELLQSTGQVMAARRLAEEVDFASVMAGILAKRHQQEVAIGQGVSQ